MVHRDWLIRTVDDDYNQAACGYVNGHGASE